jgi:hypothetical protein
MIATGTSHGLKLAQAFGIPTHQLVQFTVTVKRDAMIEVLATYRPSDANGDGVEQVRRMHLVAVPNLEPEVSGK